jgi:hypothetical protein
VAGDVLGPTEGGEVSILGFADPPLDRKKGIVCAARKGRNEFHVPLVGLQVKKENPKVPKTIERFFKKHGVTRVGMSDGNMGCPHEEGKDFPEGGDGPFCPWWKGKQGSGAKE